MRRDNNILRRKIRLEREDLDRLRRQVRFYWRERHRYNLVVRMSGEGGPGQVEETGQVLLERERHRYNLVVRMGHSG